jgi:dihydrofolate synthase/folylpolyglutamate synthase
MVGMMGLKDSDGFLNPFRGLVRRVLTVPIPRAHETPHAPEALAETARSVGLEAECSSDIETALQRIDQLEPGAKRILVCGSLYLAGHVLALQDGVEPQAN